MVPGNTGKFLAFWTAFSRAGFAFITSPELIAISAGETIAPRRNIPKAARRFIYRLAVFYGLGSFVIGVIVPRNDPDLLGASNASASPFVIGIKNAGIEGLDHVINAAVLTSAWSAGNAFLYSGSRVLFSMALSGQAPGFLKRTTKRGIPFAAVLVTWAIGLLSKRNTYRRCRACFKAFASLHVSNNHANFQFLTFRFSDIEQYRRNCVSMVQQHLYNKWYVISKGSRSTGSPRMPRAASCSRPSFEFFDTPLILLLLAL